jgi:hypothetical protein
VVSPNAAAGILSGIMAVGLNIDDVGATRSAVTDVIAMANGGEAPHRSVDYVTITKDNLQQTVPPGLRGGQ